MRDVVLASAAIAAVCALSLAILFRSARAGSPGQHAIAALLAALSMVVLAIFGFAAVVRAITHADVHSTAYTAAWAFAAYALTLATPLARGLQTLSRRRVAAGDASEPRAHPVGLPPTYWLVELVTFTLLSAIVLTGMRVLDLGRTAALFVVVPLCLALPDFMRTVVGRRFYGARLLTDLAANPAAEPDGVEPLREWTSDTARALGLGDFTVVVLPLGATFTVPLWRSARLIVIDTRLYAALDPQDRRALVAHEIAHAERNDGNRRALLIMGVTLWLFVLMDLWGTRSRNWPVGTMYIIIFIFITVLDHARRTLSHRAEFGADRRAAEIVGDRQAMVRTLTRMAQRHGAAATRDTRSHPSLARRIAALQS